MDGDEPQMRDGASQQAVHRRTVVEPGEKPVHLGRDAYRRRRLEVDPLSAHRPGDDPHRAVAIGPPVGDRDLADTGVTGRKQRRVPSPKTLRAQCPAVVLRGVKHHVDDPVGGPVEDRHASSRHAKAPGHRRPHDGRIQRLPLDLRGLHDILGGRLQLRFDLEVEAELAHRTQQPSVPASGISQRRQQGVGIPAERRPIAPLPQVHFSHSPHGMRTICEDCPRPARRGVSTAHRDAGFQAPRGRRTVAPCASPASR